MPIWEYSFSPFYIDVYYIMFCQIYAREEQNMNILFGLNS